MRALATDLWVAERPLPLVVGDIGARMTVIRLRDGGLLLHSPVRLDDARRRALDAIGPVRAVVWVVGARGRFGPHRMVRTMIPDRAVARASVARLLEWDFDRVIVSHGEVLESGGRARLAAGFAFL